MSGSRILLCIVLAWLVVYPMTAIASITLKIVAFVSEKGEWAEFGRRMHAGYEAAMTLNGYPPPFELIYIDCSEIANLKPTLLDYAELPGVVAFIGGMPDQSSFLIAETAEDLGIPYVVDANPDDSLTQTPRNHVFRISPPAKDFNDGVISWAATVAGHGRLAAVLHEEHPDYARVKADLEQDLSRHWEGDKEWIPYPGGISDFNGQIELLRQTNPAIVWLIGNTTDAARFFRQCRQANYLPYVFILGVSDLVNNRMISLSENASEYAVSSKVWVPDEHSPEIRDYCETYFQLNHEKPDYRSASCTANIQIFQHIITNNEDISREMIRLQLSENRFRTVFGDVEFRSDGRYYNQNRHVTYAVQQLKDGWREIWPPEAAEADDVYPIPDWRERSRFISRKNLPWETWFLFGITMVFVIGFLIHLRHRKEPEE